MTRPDDGGGEETGDKPARATRKVELAGFSPSAASPGAKVEIFGSGFSRSATGNKLTVGGVEWLVDDAKPTRLLATVPEEAKAGTLTIKVGSKAVTSASSFTTLVDDGAFARPGPAYNGLLGDVFPLDAGASSMPDFSTLGEPTATIAVGPIDIAEKILEQGLPGRDGKPTPTFAIRFRGSLNVTEEGEYELCVASDDGSRLFLEDTLVVDNDGTHGAREKCEIAFLEPGEYMLRLEYFQGDSATAALVLSWAKDGAAKSPIPLEALFQPEDRGRE